MHSVTIIINNMLTLAGHGVLIVCVMGRLKDFHHYDALDHTLHCFFLEDCLVSKLYLIACCYSVRTLYSYIQLL